MATAYLSHPACLLHENAPGNPESKDRLRAIERRFIDTGLMKALAWIEAPSASLEELCRVHSQGYIEALYAQSPDQGFALLDSDTQMNPHTLDAALFSAGAAVHAVDLVLSGSFENAFCNVRPPGHHAGVARAAGFCFFNNVAVAAAHALEFHGIGRVAIADFDVHHGNGTESIFRGDPRVMLCSTYQHPLFPSAEAGVSGGNVVNVPLPAGAGSAEFRDLVQRHWLPALDSFNPDLLLISAGFDGHRNDKMSGLNLSEDDYTWVTQVLKRYAKGRIVSVLEGGYDLDSLSRSAEAHVQELVNSATSS